MRRPQAPEFSVVEIWEVRSALPIRRSGLRYCVVFSLRELIDELGGWTGLWANPITDVDTEISLEQFRGRDLDETNISLGFTFRYIRDLPPEADRT